MPRNFDNPFDMRRFAGMIGSQQQPGNPLMKAYRGINFGGNPQMQQPDAPQGPPEPPDPLTAALARLQGGQAAGAYRQHLANMPDPAKLAPSKGRRFGAALAAAAGGFQDPRMGLAIGEQIRDAPYRGALEQWQMKGAGLKEQADIEQQDVKGQLEYIKAVRDQQQKEREFGLNKRKVDIDEDQARTTRLYREAQIENMQNEGWVKDTDAEGNTVMINPRNGQQKNFGPSIEGRRAKTAEGQLDVSRYNAQTSRGQLGVSQGQLGVSQQNAQTAQGQLGLGRERLATQSMFDQGNLNARNRGLDIGERNAGAAGFVSPTEVFQSEALGTKFALQQNPDWAGWVNPDGTVKTPQDYDNWGPFNGTPPSLQDPTYREFLAAVEAGKRQAIGTRRPGVGMGGPGVGGPGVAPIKFGDLPK